MKRELIMLFTLFLFGVGIAVAQTRVRGVVVDDVGDPVIGATIQTQGTTRGTVSDIDGNFSLSAPADGSLIISYVGYQTRQVPVSENVKAVLILDTEILEELVVTAMGACMQERQPCRTIME